MRKLVALLAVLAMMAAACGDSGGSGALDTCDDLAQEGVDLLQDILDEVSEMSMEDFLNAADEETPAFLEKFEGDADRLDAAQADLGCSDAELSAYVIDNIDQLTASGTVGELLLEAIKADPGGFVGP